MYPIILERDNHIVSWADGLAAWSTTAASVEGGGYRMVSDGLLNADYGAMHIFQLCNPLLGKMEGAGLNITQPETLDEYTPYEIHAVAMTEDPLVRPYLFVGISAATITNASTGDLLSKCKIIGTADYDSDTGSAMDRELTIIVPKMPVGLETRGLAIGIGMMAGTVNAGNDHAFASLSVRRLPGNSPAIMDTRKL